MPVLSNLRKELASRNAALKSLEFPLSSGGTFGGGWMGGGIPYKNRVDVASSVGDLWMNATCMTCIAWMQRTLPEPPLEVMKPGPKEPVAIEKHPMVQLINRPNPHYSGKRLWQMTILSFMSSGNAYWFKGRGGTHGPVKELWYRPHFMMQPVADSTDYISHYWYFVNGKRVRIEAEDVVHFRYGVNPRNEIEGMTPWAANLPHIGSDNDGAIYSYNILHNNGAMAGVASPRDPEKILDPADAEIIKAHLNEQMALGNAGGWKVSPGAIQLDKTTFSPEELTLDKLQTFPQGMICAAVGLSDMLLDLPGGAAAKTYANKTEAREAAVEQNVIPTLDMFGDELDLQLLPDFDKDAEHHATFNLSNVRVLQEDVSKQWTRALDAKVKGVLTPNEARAVIGYDKSTDEGADKLQVSKPPMNNPQPNDPNAQSDTGGQ